MSVDARAMDEAYWYVLDTTKDELHGADGGPFPYSNKAAAASVAARWNRKEKVIRRYRAVTWLLCREN